MRQELNPNPEAGLVVGGNGELRVKKLYTKWTARLAEG